MSLVDNFLTWYRQNAYWIAAIEFLIIIMAWPGKVLWWLLLKYFRKLPEDKAEIRHRELVDLRTAFNQLEIKPLHNDQKYARLPDGTLIIERKNGQLRLTMPLPKISISTGIPSMTAMLAPGKKDKEKRAGLE